jgi:hypothetical protein
MEFVIVSASITLAYAYLVHRLIYRSDSGDVVTPAVALERAEKRFAMAKNVAGATFLVASVLKFALHNGWIAKSLTGLAALVVGIPLMIAVAAYLKARWEVKRANAQAGPPSGDSLA